MAEALLSWTLPKCFSAQFITFTWGRQEADVVHQRWGRNRSKFGSLNFWCLGAPGSIVSDLGWCHICCNCIHRGYAPGLTNSSPKSAPRSEGVVRIQWSDLKIWWFLPEYFVSTKEGWWWEHPLLRLGTNKGRCHFLWAPSPKTPPTQVTALEWSQVLEKLKHLKIWDGDMVTSPKINHHKTQYKAFPKGPYSPCCYLNLREKWMVDGQLVTVVVYNSVLLSWRESLPLMRDHELHIAWQPKWDQKGRASGETCEKLLPLSHMAFPE